MKRALIHIAMMCLVFGPASAASPRVALLPFSNLSENPHATTVVMTFVRHDLAARSIDLADSATVAEILRKHRVRNTTELSAESVDTVAAETSVRYLLLGSIDRYTETDSTGEVALSARLLDVATSTIVWAETAVEYGDPRVDVLGLGAHHALTLARRASEHVLKNFRFEAPSHAKVVQAIRVRGDSEPVRPCRRIMVVTFGNESDTHFAGNIVADEALVLLLRRGFSPVDPGRVREMMLRSGDLMQGEISRELLIKCGRDLGADFVLTGTVSRFESQHGQSFEEPAAAFEARLIDTKKGEVVWAKTYSREGKDSSWIFGVGYVHGLADLSQRMCRRFVRDLPVITGRGTSPQPALAEGK